MQPLSGWGLLASADEVREAEPGPGKKEGGRGKGREAEPQDAFRQPGDRSPSCTRFYPPRVNRILTWQAPNEQRAVVCSGVRGSWILSPLSCEDFTVSCYDWGVSHSRHLLCPGFHSINTPTPPVEPPEEAVTGQLWALGMDPHQHQQILWYDEERLTCPQPPWS